MNFMQDMTKGSPFKLLLSFSIPLLIGSLFQQFYTMADSIIVGKFVGADALASIGACSSVIYLLFSLFLGLSARKIRGVRLSPSALRMEEMPL